MYYEIAKRLLKSEYFTYSWSNVMIVGDICILCKAFHVCGLYRWSTDAAYTGSLTENHTQKRGKRSGLPRIMCEI